VTQAIFDFIYKYFDEKIFLSGDLNNVLHMALWNVIFFEKPNVVVLFHYYNITTQDTCVIVLIVMPCGTD
jgi:hypothetical protein